MPVQVGSRDTDELSSEFREKCKSARFRKGRCMEMLEE